MIRISVDKLFVLTVLSLAFSLPASLHGQEPMQIDGAKKQAIVDEVSRYLNADYVFPETAKRMEQLIRTRLKNGDYDYLSDAATFAESLSKDLTSVSNDKHLGFAYRPQMAAEIDRLRSQDKEQAKTARNRQMAEMERDNFGFRKVERLAGNIGYLDFRAFVSPSDAGATAVAAMNFLARCDAVIIDLRQNGGGDPAQIQLISSYFFDEPVHLNDIYFRAENRTDNFWTLPYVPGPRPVKADLYILTSSRTFSGAEEFSYNMKNLKRATLIGETTGGGAHPTEPRIVQEKFILRVPFARAINPVSKTNWEGTGVTPDVQVPAAKAFDSAYRMALEKLASKANDPVRKSELNWLLTGEDAKQNPPRLDEGTLKSYAGIYGERKVTFKDGVLYYQRTGPQARMTALTPTLFGLEGLDFFRVEFQVKDGKVTGLVGLYDDGRQEPSSRTGP